MSGPHVEAQPGFKRPCQDKIPTSDMALKQ